MRKISFMDYSDIIMDWCPACGSMFFDREELKRMHGYLKAVGGKPQCEGFFGLQHTAAHERDRLEDISLKGALSRREHGVEAEIRLFSDAKKSLIINLIWVLLSEAGTFICSKFDLSQTGKCQAPAWGVRLFDKQGYPGFISAGSSLVRDLKELQQSSAVQAMPHSCQFLRRRPDRPR